MIERECSHLITNRMNKRIHAATTTFEKSRVTCKVGTPNAMAYIKKSVAHKGPIDPLDSDTDVNEDQSDSDAKSDDSSAVFRNWIKPNHDKFPQPHCQQKQPVSKVTETNSADALPTVKYAMRDRKKRKFVHVQVDAAGYFEDNSEEFLPESTSVSDEEFDSDSDTNVKSPHRCDSDDFDNRGGFASPSGHVNGASVSAPAASSQLQAQQNSHYDLESEDDDIEEYDSPLDNHTTTHAEQESRREVKELVEYFNRQTLCALLYGVNTRNCVNPLKKPELVDRVVNEFPSKKLLEAEFDDVFQESLSRVLKCKTHSMHGCVTRGRPSATG